MLYGQKPGISEPGKELVKAGISEVIDQGSEVAVLFSVVNVQSHAVELMPPQVQLGGKKKTGKIIRRSRWSTSEQLPVADFRMSRRRIGPAGDTHGSDNIGKIRAQLLHKGLLVAGAGQEPAVKRERIERTEETQTMDDLTNKRVDRNHALRFSASRPDLCSAV